MSILSGLIAGPEPGWAGDQKNATGSANGGGTTISFDHNGSDGGSTGGGGGGGGRSCWSMRPAELTTDHSLGGPIKETQPEGPTPTAKPYDLFCDGTWVGLTWIEPGVNPALADPRSIAERAIRDVRLPASGIGANPSSGLVGVESWFWAVGYDGTPIARSVSAFGLVVDVEMAPAGVTWDYGDRTSAPGDLGLAYPQRSSVRHAYESDSGGPGKDYTVTMTIDFAPRYRVMGGPWIVLPDVAQSRSVSYHVVQAQAVVDDAR